MHGDAAAGAGADASFGASDEAPVAAFWSVWAAGVVVGGGGAALGFAAAPAAATARPFLNDASGPLAFSVP